MEICQVEIRFLGACKIFEDGWAKHVKTNKTDLLKSWALTGQYCWKKIELVGLIDRNKFAKTISFILYIAKSAIL